MAQKREQRFTIRMFPWRAGLASAGQQTSIPEDQLWQAKNVTGMLDGLLAKRPGTKQWGQTLKIPDPAEFLSDGVTPTGSTITSFVTFLAGVSGFAVADSSSDLITQDTTQPGVLKTGVRASNLDKHYTASHVIDTLSVGEDWSLRFVFSGTNLPAYVADATVPNTFVFRAQAKASSGKEFAIHQGGIYYQKDADDKYELITGTEKAGQGAWTVVEVRCNDATSGTTDVYIDGTKVTTTAIDSSLMKNVSPTGIADFEFYWKVQGTDPAATSGTQYNTGITTVMYNDSVVAPFKDETIDGVTDYQYVSKGGANRFALLAAAGKYIYADNGLLGVWRPLKARQRRGISFTKYRNTVIWIDTDGSQQSSMWMWDGSSDPEHLDDAPPVQFAVEHQQRLLAGGDPLNPRRMYYTGVGQPNVWYSPSPTNTEDQFDTALEAGFVPIPSGEKSGKLTAVVGDYYGAAVGWSTKGAWKLSGYGPASYRLDRVAGVDVGCEGPNCWTQVGNDIWFLGRQGLQSLAATEKFGDLQTQFPSAPIQDLWTQNPTSVTRISTQFLSKANLDYNPPQGLVYMAVPTTGETEPDSVYVFNVNTKAWLGPWEINSRAMANIEIGMPRIEVMMHGAEDGVVHYTDQSVNTDAVGGDINMVLESAYLNGRSLPDAAQLIGPEKSWKRIRLYVLPRGEWDLKIDAEVDSQTKMTQQVRSQNTGGDNRSYTLTNDWKINANPAGRLRSLEEMRIIEVIPDLRGPNMKVLITQPNAGENLVVQGLEVEFTIAGYEEE